ncbi:MAG: cell division protein FtsL [Betaproteobacteria bacterium]|nr:cell division protein FtsL [Betaproteobacteria bacterium]
MTRLNLVLMLALVLSALALVQTAYESRRLFAEIERAKADLARLESDHARLLAERQAQATNLRVERLARNRLQMTPISPQVTQYVIDAPRRPGASAQAPETQPEGVR